MMARLVLVLLLGVAGACAQLQLMTIPGQGLEEPVGQFLDVGSSAAGDALDTRLRIRNQGEQSVTLDRLRVQGVGFSLEGHPTVPHIVAPGSNVDFRLRFKPTGPGSYSGTLRINDIQLMVFGQSPATLALMVEEEGVFRPLSSGEAIAFGPVMQGEVFERRFRLDNPAYESLTANQLSIGSGPFQLVEAPTPPIEMPSGTSVSFAVRYAPEDAGLHQTTLALNQRTFVLEGFALHPPFPDLEILVDPQTPRSATQAKIAVRLAAPAPAPGKGELTMNFIPAKDGAFDDPAVQFLTRSGRTLSLTAEKGQTSVAIEGLADASFQTGATAGVITFRAELADEVREASIVLPGTPVELTATSWRRTATGVEVAMEGFDNTLSATSVSFQFFDTAGRALTAEPLRADVAKAFQDHFATSYIGGLFTLTAAFPVAGDTSLLGAVEVQFTNSDGLSVLQRIQLQ